MTMRSLLQRLFVVFVCLSVLFSNSLCVFASTDDFRTQEDFGVEFSTFEQLDTSSGQYKILWASHYGSLSYGTFYPSKDLYAKTLGSDSLNATYTTTIKKAVGDPSYMDGYWREQFYVYPTGDIKLANKGSNVQFSLSNIKMSLLGLNADGDLKRYSYFDPSSIAQIDLIVYDKDNNAHFLESITDNFKVSADGLNVTIGADFNNVPCDVYAVNIAVIYYPTSAFNNNNGDDSCTSTSWNWATLKKGWGYDNSKLVLNVDDNVSGLLSSIIGFIQSILDSVTKIFTKIGDFMTAVANSFSQLFTKLGNWFSDLIASIVELPSRIWNLIETGLKNLFVPDEAFIEDYKADWETTLSDRFGAIYQSIEILIDYVSLVENNVVDNTITMPSTTIDLPDGEQFTFGGYEVKVVPNGFDFLADAVKFAIDVVCTLAVINSLKRRYERLMEG